MELDKLNSFIGNNNMSIVDAMEKIDANASGILFIVDNNKKLVGSLTDGDIRRWILKSGSISADVTFAMNKNPLSISKLDEKDAHKLMTKNKINALPVINDNGCIIDIYFLNNSTNANIKRDTLSNVPVVIMAGGKGTRLYPYTKILPKPLIPIGDTPIVERIINYYTEFGINNFYLTINYKKAMIRSYFNDISRDYSINYVEETEPLGTCGSLKLITDNFDGPLFVTNSDALILADYADIYKNHIENKNDITVVSALKNIQVPYGVLNIGDNGLLKSIEEKPKLSYFINTGMYIINPNLIKLIPNKTIFHMTQLVEKVMSEGGKVGTYPVSEDSFLDMGDNNEMKRMEEKLHLVSIQ